MSKHTPGPWRIRRLIDVASTDRNIIEHEAFEIVAGSRTGPHRNMGHFHPSNAEYYIDELHVVQAGCDRDYNTIDGGIENEADARLIAAAPELLEACKEALEAISIVDDGRGNTPSYLERAEKLLKAAIQKAEGTE